MPLPVLTCKTLGLTFLHLSFLKCKTRLVPLTSHVVVRINQTPLVGLAPGETAGVLRREDMHGLVYGTCSWLWLLLCLCVQCSHGVENRNMVLVPPATTAQPSLGLGIFSWGLSLFLCKRSIWSR